MTEGSSYILAKKIARGGMAEIYLGKHVGEDGFQRLCAIKRILPHYAGDKEFVQMFRDEAHICKRLQHANIVRVEGFEEVEGSYAIIMEFIDGSDLRSLLHACEQASERPSMAMACYTIAETARGLHYAHTKVDEITQQPLGIVHRDISPQNILLSFEGEVKVTDFGIADAESKLTETRPGIVKGKYSYMSPEQITAKSVDARTDVFALGIVLWEMLAMRRLFQGENEVATIQLVKNCKIDKNLRQLNPEVDAELEAVVAKALAKDPKKRYLTAAELEKDLRRYMSLRYPEFTPDDLGSFLKKVLTKKRAESAQDIKRTLTETNLKGAGRAGRGRKRSVDLAFESSQSGPAISVAKPQSLAESRSSTGSQFPSLPARTTTSFGQPTFSRASTHTGFGTKAFAEKSTEQNRFLFLGIVASLVLVVSYGALVTFPSKPPEPPVLIVRSQPSRVQIKLDKKPLNGGRYVTASTQNPYKMKIKPGVHHLAISRPGYRTYRYRFRASEGEVIERRNIVLRERGKRAKVLVRMKPQTPMRIDINDGFFVTDLMPSKRSAVAPDLRYDKSYRMLVTPKNKKAFRAFKCSFRPRATDWRKKNVVVIDHRKRKCTVKGPQG